MRTTMTDDGDSDWSMEILDGDCVNAPAELLKKTPPTCAADTGSELTTKQINPFFLNNFSTTYEVAIPETQSTGEENANFHALNGHKTLLPREFTDERHTTSATHGAKKPRQLKSFVLAHDSPDSYNHEQSQLQTGYNVVTSHDPIQLMRDASSSSTQNNSASKGEESSLPAYSFMEYKVVPAVVYTKSESEANTLVQTLKGPLGFDLEWRVMWQRGAPERRTALVQLCDHRTILLIQVSRMKRFPKKVLDVIESADVVKTGANILNDGEKLFRDFGIRAKGLVELGAFATKADDNFRTVYNREIVSLAKMVAMYLGRTLLKGKVRTSNWEANLSQKMVEYAANDCHCALMVYNTIQDIATKAGKTLDLTTYSCQVIPRPPKVNNASFPPLQRGQEAPVGARVPHYCIPEPPRPQQLRAYKLWHMDKMPLDQMCMKLRIGARVEPLKESTVISYVIGALQADPRLPFDMGELKSLVLMEASSWQRHQQWISSRE